MYLFVQNAPSEKKGESILKSLLNEFEDMGHVEKPSGDAAQEPFAPPINKTVPWKTCLHIKSPSLRLHQEIQYFNRCLKATPYESKSRKEAVSRVSEIVTSIWPNARVEVFGSFATGLYLPTSDIDAVILDSKCDDIKKGLKALARSLSVKGISVDLQVILKARVPIIKFQEKDSGYNFDISFDVANGPEAAYNVRNLVKQIPAMMPLVMVLKVFLQQRELNEVYSGGIGSYALLVLVASFLQTHTSRYMQGYQSANLGELLMDFFRLHGRALQQEVVGVSCSKGGKFFKKKILNFHNPSRPFLWSVEDPNDSTNDLGKNSYNATRVRQAFDHAYTVLTAPIKPGESMLARIIRLDSILFTRFDGKEVKPSHSMSSSNERKRKKLTIDRNRHQSKNTKVKSKRRKRERSDSDDTFD